ncbi:hypothetical protein POKO110462_21115 [Pontibacter korlensis]|uniref:ADP,ATP carrier protein n=1 Tax=Pontibacter korlensis TaxID=400092 RepID=A0A0E3ZGB7_9BACT|nr:hypothetical protein [Pontibacter korlensis]AKD04049.1 hypothetical protein PKOR_14290 [Pontibacter korlensis]
MFRELAKHLNIKSGEVRLVRSLFLVQFLLGAAIAFFSTASLALFLSSFEVTVLPKVYLMAGACLLLFNYVYTHVEHRFTPAKLLQLASVFSAFSIFLCWLAYTFFYFEWLTIALIIWNLVIYLLIGEAFWGMVAMQFNVRESKRLFSIVGAGDIPAKMLGYLSVSVLVPFISVINLLWMSIASFTLAFVLLGKFKLEQVAAMEDAGVHHTSTAHHQPEKSIIGQIFHNSLILSIAIWFLIAYMILLLVDYTFISEIKLESTISHELATFIAVFFAFGRFLAILFKLIFSSKVIARLGLTNSLLIAPALLFLINIINLVAGEELITHLYIFGVMALIAEVLRSTLQEPVSLVLFQPLDPHSRLKGHVIAKGFTLPFALLTTGTLLSFYLQHYGELSVTFVSQLLLVLLIVWAGSVILIKRAYLHTLVEALRKGLFTGSELFLNSQDVRALLVQKTDSNRPQEVIHALDLLEQSGYMGMQEQLLRQLQSKFFEVKEYVLSRIIANNISAALSLIEEQLARKPEAELEPLLIRAKYSLSLNGTKVRQEELQQLKPENKKAALLGLLCRPGATAPAAKQELSNMATGETAEKLLALEVIAELDGSKYAHLVEALLQDSAPVVYNKAIEVAGKQRRYHLFKLAVAVAERHQAYKALHKALTYYGDAAYEVVRTLTAPVSAPLLDVLLKTAGRTKGEASTLFLEGALKHYPAKADLVVEALWEKKAEVSVETKKGLEQWLDDKLSQGQLKKQYYLQLMPDNEATLLQEAICSEIHQDIQSILKGLALVYDQQRIDRVIELYKMGSMHKLSNAVEMLELLVSKKYFTSLDDLIEFREDVKNNQLRVTSGRDVNTAAVVDEILTGNRATCNSWTRAVACYLIPRLQDKEFLLPALARVPDNGDPLFRETRTYVVSMLS